MPELRQLIVADATNWRAWLDAHHGGSPGVWLVLAKKGASTPTELRYDDALDEALCFGWIDGQKRSRDEVTFAQRFTPRRPGSRWSQRNVDIAERLEAEGRLHPAGRAEIAAARADGRWSMAYPGAATMTVPDDLQAALAADPDAAAAFTALSGQNRYSILYRLATASRPETRARRLTQFLETLRRGETPH